MLITNLEQRRLHCFPLNFLRIPVGVDTTSPFLYLWGVAGRDLGEVGVDLRLPIAIMPGSNEAVIPLNM